MTVPALDRVLLEKLVTFPFKCFPLLSHLKSDLQCSEDE
jgi:hypothetical protein